MRPVDFHDSVSKIPGQERIAQQREQQPITSQHLNIRADQVVAEAKIDSPQPQQGAQQPVVDRHKRDREFRKGRRRRHPEDEKRRPSGDTGSHIVDLEA